MKECFLTKSNDIWLFFITLLLSKANALPFYPVTLTHVTRVHIAICTPQLGEQNVLHANQSEKVKGGILLTPQTQHSDDVKHLYFETYQNP